MIVPPHIRADLCAYTNKLSPIYCIPIGAYTHTDIVLEFYAINISPIIALLISAATRARPKTRLNQLAIGQNANANLIIRPPAGLKPRQPLFSPAAENAASADVLRVEEEMGGWAARYRVTLNFMRRGRV